MKICKRCSVEKLEIDFYSKDNSCKECRKALVRNNRALKINHYRMFDKARAMNPCRVQARANYQKTESGKQAIRRCHKRYIERNKAKRAAHITLGNAVRDNKVLKKSKCETCGATVKLHGHHDDYSKPLEVRWLCLKCHREWHKAHGEAKNP